MESDHQLHLKVHHHTAATNTHCSSAKVFKVNEGRYSRRGRSKATNNIRDIKSLNFRTKRSRSSLDVSVSRKYPTKLEAKEPSDDLRESLLLQAVSFPKR